FIRAESDSTRHRSLYATPSDKLGILLELARPTGYLSAVVQLVAAPELASTVVPEPPARLVNATLAANPAQARAVALALGLREGQVLLVQGPPGTGKSTTAAEIITQWLERHPARRLPGGSHSNHLTDQVR